MDRSILGAAEFIETDVHGTYVLLDWARETARLVQVSSDEVYGDVPEGVSSREDDALRPSSPYSASKSGGDLQVLAAVRTFGVDACITRGVNTYGPFQYPEKLISLFVTNALDGEPLPVYGDGRQRREWLHARDHCAGVELVLREGRSGEIYNVGGKERENLDVTRRIVELTDAEPSLVSKALKIPGITDLQPTPVTGHARQVTIVAVGVTTTLPATQVRWALGLRSTWFRVGVLSLSRPQGTVAPGTAVTLAGVAKRLPQPQLEQRLAGSDWQPGPTVQPPAPDGSFTVVVQPTETTQYRLMSGTIASAVLRVPVAVSS